jgi:TolB protein
VRSATHGLVCLAILLIAACDTVEPMPPATVPPAVDGTPQPADPSAPPTAAASSPTPVASPRPLATVTGANEPLPGRIAFTVNGDLWVWQGAAGTQLTSGGTAAQPAWSPDGAQIVFVHHGLSFSDLALIGASGGTIRTITENGSTLPPGSFERSADVIWAFSPTFSPDGREIGYASQIAPPVGAPLLDHPLALMRRSVVPGAATDVLYQDAYAHVGRIAYTPDGSQIIFSITPIDRRAPARLMAYDRQRSVTAPLIGAPDQSYDPAISPDGRWLVFATRDGGHTDVFALNLRQGGLTRLTQRADARAPAISPDGSYLAYLAVAPGGAGFDLWVAELFSDATGRLFAGEARRITNDLQIDATSGLAWGR